MKLPKFPETKEEKALKFLEETDPDIVKAHKLITNLQLAAGAVILIGSIIAVYKDQIARALGLE